jgi:glycosyltransferase involved in cell wall biosynthesis
MTYVLATAAYNEEAFIEATIQSVLAQTLRPKKWVIVSDGSTDCTDEIVRFHAAKHDFIQLHRITEPHPRNFVAQAHAINAGFALLRSGGFTLPASATALRDKPTATAAPGGWRDKPAATSLTGACDFIGNLDADITLEPDYFARLIEKFKQDAKLGLAGGWICERRNGCYAPRRSNSTRSVAHAVQLFRRECMDMLGGYAALPYGGPDWHAEVCARMAGWRVEAFPELKAFHQRLTGGVEGRLRFWYREGLIDFSLGGHPLFEMFKLARRLREKPAVIGSAVAFAAFMWAECRGEERAVSEDFVRFVRAEQMQRVRRLWSDRPHHGAHRGHRDRQTVITND